MRTTPTHTMPRLTRPSITSTPPNRRTTNKWDAFLGPTSNNTTNPLPAATTQRTTRRDSSKKPNKTIQPKQNITKPSHPNKTTTIQTQPKITKQSHPNKTTTLSSRHSHSNSQHSSHSQAKHRSRRSSIAWAKVQMHAGGDHLKHLVHQTHEHHKQGRALRRDHKQGESVAKQWQKQVYYEGVGVHWKDCYLQYLTTLSWPGMMLFFVLVIYCQLMLLAAIYWLSDPNYLYDPDNDGKFKAWNLAVQTYLTIGYGVLTPSPTWWSILWGFLATSLALVDVAIITGVPYIKFSKPRCKILFSTVVTVNMHEGEPTLTIRIGKCVFDEEKNNRTRIILTYTYTFF